MPTEQTVALAGLALGLLTVAMAGFGFLWSELKDLGIRLRHLEAEFRFMEPFAEATKRKLQVDAAEWMRRPP